MESLSERGRGCPVVVCGCPELLWSVVMERPGGPFCLHPFWHYLLTGSSLGDMVCEKGVAKVQVPVPGDDLASNQSC